MFVENVSNTLQGIVLTFWDAHTYKQDKTIMPLASPRGAEA